MFGGSVYLYESDSPSLGGNAAHHLIAQLPDELVRDHEHQQVGSLCSIAKLRDGHLQRVRSVKRRRREGKCSLTALLVEGGGKQHGRESEGLRALA